MRIVVLGASGRLGRMLHWAWKDRSSHDIIWHVGRQTAPSGAASGSYMSGDLLDPHSALCEALRAAEVIVNLAGVTPGPDADLSRNIALGVAPFHLAPDARILTASSGAVYGRSEIPLSEFSNTAPLSPYGLSKLHMEQAISKVAMDRAHILLRIGNVAGADQLLGGLSEDRPQLHCFDDGSTPVRSYIGPRGFGDAIAALLTVQSSPTNPALNLAAPYPVSMGALLDAADRPYTPVPAPSDLTRRVVLDTARLQRMCPELTLAHSAQALVEEWTAFRDFR